MSRDRTWRALAGVACLMLCSAGCQVFRTRAKPPSLGPVQADPVFSPAQNAQADAGVVRSNFKSEPTPEQSVGVHLALARAHDAQGSHEAAVQAYQRAIDACRKLGRSKTNAPTQALAHRKMAAALDRMGRFAQAETHYQAAAKLSPNDSKIWNDKGYSLYLQGRYDDAETSLRTAAKLDPGDARIQTNLGLALAALGRNDAALEALTQAGGGAAAHANLAYLLAAKGQTDDARRHYELALEQQPNFDAARAGLARLDREVTPATVLTTPAR